MPGLPPSKTTAFRSSCRAAPPPCRAAVPHRSADRIDIVVIKPPGVGSRRIFVVKDCKAGGADLLPVSELHNRGTNHRSAHPRPPGATNRRCDQLSRIRPTWLPITAAARQGRSRRACSCRSLHEPCIFDFAPQARRLGCCGLLSARLLRTHAMRRFGPPAAIARALTLAMRRYIAVWIGLSAAVILINKV
eukprot:358390-Chlamydomonas_euryale.AAC.10